MFTILFVSANTMSMAVRERRTEIAVLKTLGFPSRFVMCLILSEGAILGAFGAVTGLLLGRFLLDALPNVPLIGDLIQSFPRMSLPRAIAIGGIAIGVLLGLTAGLIPAVLAYRARITELVRPT
jgi:putative ABC transport system permease protein